MNNIRVMNHTITRGGKLKKRVDNNNKKIVYCCYVQTKWIIKNLTECIKTIVYLLQWIYLFLQNNCNFVND